MMNFAKLHRALEAYTTVSHVVRKTMNLHI